MKPRHSLCTLNVGGMSSKACLGTKVSHIRKNYKNTKLILIQETNTPPESCAFLSQTVGLSSAWTNHVGIINNEPNYTIINTRKYMDGRILLCEIETPDSQPFWVGSIYAPVEPRANQQFWIDAQNITWPTNLILGGDFNVWTSGARDRWPPVGWAPQGATSYLDFMIKARLADTYRPHQSAMSQLTRWEQTWVEGKRVPTSATRIDKILVTGNWVPGIRGTYTEASSISDHLALSVDIFLPSFSTHKKNNKPWRPAPHLLKIDWVRKRIQEITIKPISDDPMKTWAALKNKITSELKKCQVKINKKKTQLKQKQKTL